MRGNCLRRLLRSRCRLEAEPINIMKGEREPQLSALVRMADFYDVSLDYLAGRRDTP